MLIPLYQKVVDMECPRCGGQMIYRMESESYNKRKRQITSYYKCPVCGYRIDDQKIVLEGINGSVRIRAQNLLSIKQRRK